MRPKGTSEHLAGVRNRGLSLLEAGKKPKEVAEILKVTPRCVYRWRQEAKAPRRKKAARPPGRPPKLSKQQLQCLEKALDRGAYAFGYAGDYWTLDRIAQVVWQLFKVRYHPSAVWHILDRLGWSNQRQQRRPLHRDDQAVMAWPQKDLPVVKKDSRTERHAGA